MRLRPEVRVGLIVFAAVIALFTIFLFLGNWGLRGNTYFLYATFDNVQTVQNGTDVRMAGVVIGRVKDIVLTPDNRAKVIMRISNNYKVPKDSVAKISSAGVVGEYYVEIVPSESKAYAEPESTLRTQEITTINDLLAQASGLMEGLKGLTDNLEITTSGLNKLLGDEQMVASIKNTVSNLELASQSGLAIAERLNQTVEASSPEIQRVLARVARASEELGVITRDFETISRTARGELVEGGGIARMQATLRNAETTSQNLATASAGLSQLINDPQLQEDIRVTAAQARIASTQAAEITGRLSKVGRKKERTEADLLKQTYVPQKGLRFDAFGTTEDNPFRADINYTITPFFDENFYRIGVRDLGEDTGFNLQAGKGLGKTSAFRYGLYASRLGIGYDKQVTSNLSVHADLFDLNDLSLELKGFYQYDPNWGLWLGTDNLIDDSNLLVGFQYRK